MSGAISLGCISNRTGGVNWGYLVESFNHHIQRIEVHLRGSWELLKILSRGVSDPIIITAGHLLS